jgi:hypothetical protein
MATREPLTTSDGYVLNAAPDVPDIRDRLYQPALIPIGDELRPDRSQLTILDQGAEGACTGFGLAAAINLQLAVKHGGRHEPVSPRMLYEMAKRFDEWTGEDYSGSSIRGALRGFFNNGVCRDAVWPYRADRPGNLTLERARSAREVVLGAYYRVRPDIADMHAALAETGVVYVSSRVHPGWNSPGNGAIEEHPLYENGGHAFIVVGYTARGFIVQNSWGDDWGDAGLALWSYRDWARSVSDAWVFQIGVSTPDAFDIRRRLTFSESEASGGAARAPRQADIAGHYAHLDDGNFHDRGRFSTRREDVAQTFRYLKDETAKFKHVLFYAHGGLNAPKASASRIHAMKRTFKENGIYPFHFMYDTGLAEELKDVIAKRGDDANDRAGFNFLDRIFEIAVRRLGTLIWDEMKGGARKSFESSGGGTAVLKICAREMADRDIKVHLAGHSTGAILLGHLLDRAAQLDSWNFPLTTCSLFAPACRTEFFNEKFAPRINRQAARGGQIEDLTMYALDDEQERDDTVTPIYRKSLLYLVSNAFERQGRAPILGMEKYHDEATLDDVSVVLSRRGGSPRSMAKTHGGFDNDPDTMNDMLKRILGRKPQVPFTKEILDY